MRNRTLSLKMPFGMTFCLSLIFASILVGLLEVSLRTAFVKPYLGELVPRLGSRHRQLEIQFARLERIVSEEGYIDCVIMGSSLVWLGVNPTDFEEAYAQETGQAIRCFSLGVETLPASAADEIAELVVQRYQPWLLIYGTSARDYVVDNESEETRVILDTPWLQYQQGQGSLRGWLFTHSFTLRYSRSLRTLLILDTEALREMRQDMSDLSGFLAKNRPAQEVNLRHADEDAARWLEHYEIRQENLRGLEQVLKHQSSGIQIVIAEMPVSSMYYDYFGGGKADYDRFVKSVETLVRSHSLPFLRAPADQPIPEQGWWDRSHMNAVGAEIYSRWLGEEVGKEVINGPMAPLVPIQ